MLSAAGGDGRFGGLADLVSISPNDAREGVYARFAVVRALGCTMAMMELTTQS